MKKENRRNESFTSRPITQIWQEVPSANNPYQAEECLCHGYELFDLAGKVSFIDTLYLIFKGELPSPEQSHLLEKWWQLSINPGPRHPATRAGMNAAVGKTNAAHFLPISMSLLGGDHLGAEEVRRAMKFIKQNLKNDPVLTAMKMKTVKKNERVAPGFGSRFGSRDLISNRVGNYLSQFDGSKEALKWANEFSSELEMEDMGWLDPGVAAAVMIDLDISDFAAMGLFQLARAPGLLAHSVEMSDKPLHAMPFLKDEQYIIEE